MMFAASGSARDAQEVVKLASDTPRQQLATTDRTGRMRSEPAMFYRAER